MNRRNLIIYSSGLPAAFRFSKWTTPIVGSIVLPAHAQTSCAAIVSSLFSISNQQSFNFEVSNSCPTAIAGSASTSADLIIELDNPALMGTVRAADIIMNYSQTVSRQEFLSDTQSNNVPFMIELDNYENSVGALFSVSLELNYFQSTDLLEVSVSISPI